MIQIERWKKTSLGTAIDLYASHALEDLKGLRPIFLIGGVHGDEPEGVRLAKETLNWLRDRGPDEVAPWILIPCLNVDGFAKGTRVNATGVDLNRNYPSTDWQASALKERYYPGPSAGSEPEIQAIVEVIRDFSPRLLIHCHSWNPCIVATGEPGLNDATKLAASSGYEVRPEIGYPTPGSLSRYGWHDLGIPVICIEEDDKNPDLAAIWPRFREGMESVFLDKSARNKP